MVLRYVAAGLLAILSTADLVLTRYAITNFESPELNPLMAPIVTSTFGLVIKTLGVAVAGYLIARYATTAWLVKLFYGVVVLYAAIVLLNGGLIAYMEVRW